MEMEKESSPEVTETKDPNVKKRREFVDNPTIKKLTRRLDKFSNSIPELIRQYREFTVGSVPNDRTIRVYFPSPKDDSEISMVQSKMWGKLIREEELQTEAEVLESLKKRKIWSDEKENRIKSLQQKTSKLSSKLTKIINDKDVNADITQLTNDYEETEKELYSLIDIKSSYFSNSLESRINDVSMRERMWRCVKEVKKEKNDAGEEKETMTNLWNSYKELEDEKDRVLLMTVQAECMTFWQGVPSDFLDELREVQTGETDTL